MVLKRLPSWWSVMLPVRHGIPGTAGTLSTRAPSFSTATDLLDLNLMTDRGDHWRLYHRSTLGTRGLWRGAVFRSSPQSHKAKKRSSGNSCSSRRRRRAPVSRKALRPSSLRHSSLHFILCLVLHDVFGQVRHVRTLSKTTASNQHNLQALALDSQCRELDVS